MSSEQRALERDYNWRERRRSSSRVSKHKTIKPRTKKKHCRRSKSAPCKNSHAERVAASSSSTCLRPPRWTSRRRAARFRRPPLADRRRRLLSAGATRRQRRWRSASLPANCCGVHSSSSPTLRPPASSGAAVRENVQPTRLVGARFAAAFSTRAARRRPLLSAAWLRFFFFVFLLLLASDGTKRNDERQVRCRSRNLNSPRSATKREPLIFALSTDHELRSPSDER